MIPTYQKTEQLQRLTTELTARRSRWWAFITQYDLRNGPSSVGTYAVGLENGFFHETIGQENRPFKLTVAIMCTEMDSFYADDHWPFDQGNAGFQNPQWETCA